MPFKAYNARSVPWDIICNVNPAAFLSDFLSFFKRDYPSSERIPCFYYPFVVIYHVAACIYSGVLYKHKLY